MRAIEKKTAAINFRVPQTFRDKVDELAVKTGWTVSDIASLGLLAYWPEIELLVSAAGQQPPASSEEIAELRTTLEMCRSAQGRGVDLRKTLTDALEAKLAADAA